MDLRRTLLPIILVVLICVNVRINSGFAETEGKYRVDLALQTLGWAYPNEEVTAQISTFLDKSKPPEPRQPPPPLSPEDWVFIGNVPLRFEVKDEAENVVALDIPQGLKTGDDGFLEITFHAPEEEGKYMVTVFAVIEGVECSNSEEFTVSTQERVVPTVVPTPTPTPQSIQAQQQNFYIALVAILSIVAVVAAMLAIGRRDKMRNRRQTLRYWNSYQ